MTGSVKKVSSAAWVVVLLLFFSAAINYIDRGSLSVAAPTLAKELSLDPVQLGILLSAFFWTYAVFQLLSGWLVDRFPVTLVFAGGYLIWSAATLASGFAGSLGFLMVFRLFLGVGESVAFPSYSKIITATFPAESRGLPNAFLEAGTKLGPAIGTLAGGLLLANYGWRVMFWALGAGSLLWLGPWLIWGPKPATAPGATAEKSAGMWQILRTRDAWGTFLGNACYLYVYNFLLTWLPTYLVKERHVSNQMMAVLGSLPYLMAAGSAVLSGWLSDRWIRSGASPTRVRKTFVATGLLLQAVVIVPSAVVSDLTLSIVLLCTGYVAFGIFASNHWAITQTLAGVGTAGKWTGIQNTLGALTGVAAPIITGFIVKDTGSFYWAFASSAILAVVGACAYLFIVRRVAPLDWSAV